MSAGPERDAGRLTGRSELRSRSALVVLGTAMLSTGLTGPGQTVGVSVFIDHFVDDLDLSRSAVAGAYLVGTLAGAMALPMVGRFVDRRGVRITQMIIGGLFAVALANMAAVNGLVWLAVGFWGIRMLGQGSLSLVSSVSVALRFVRNRGLAIGLHSTVAAGLISLVPVGLSLVISAVGWRSAWLVAAAVIAVTVIPLAFFGLRTVPIGRDQAKAEAEQGDEGGPRSATRAEAMRTRPFWVLTAMSATAGMLATALNFHAIDLLGEVGIGETQAAALFLPQVIGSTIAGLSVGYLADRVGTRYLPALGMAVLVVAHLLAAIVSPGAVAIIYAISLGLVGGTVGVTLTALLPAWFGTAHLGSIRGAVTFMNVAGSALGPVALAVIEAPLDSYSPAVLILAILPAVVFFFALAPGSVGDRQAH